MKLSRALDVALEAARIGGDILKADFHRDGGPRGHVDKAEADLAAENAIRRTLLAEFPGYGYLGEETGRQEGDPKAPIWLVDPNDGTRDYLKGWRGSAVSIGLLEGGVPVLGVVYAFGYPDDRGDLFAWADGGPLLRNGRSVETELPESLSQGDLLILSRTAESDPEGSLEAARPARVRTLPSIAHRLALVACGDAAATLSVYSPSAWDIGAGHALLRASNGTVLREHGQPVVYEGDGSSHTERAFGGNAVLLRGLASRSWRAGHSRTDTFPGRHIDDPGLLSRAQGCLLGQLAGDSLAASGGELLVDGAERLAGQPSADSELALTLARTIVATQDYDPSGVASAYGGWYRSDPFGVHPTTRAALVGYFLGNSLSAAPIARSSPLGIFAHGLPSGLAARLGREEGALTHPNPVCRDSVAAFVVAIGKAVGGGDPRAAYEAARDWADAAPAERAVREAVMAAAESPWGVEQSLVLTALQSALFEALHARSLEAGLLSTLKRGGEVVANAATTGALLGALHGREAVPAQWRNMILSCCSHPLRAPRPRPKTLWPGDALEIAEGLLSAGRARASKV